MKYTVESLQAMGYEGFQRNPISGNTLGGCKYVLDNIAWAANYCPERLRFTRDGVGGKVRVHLLKTWEPRSSMELFAERAMSGGELQEARTSLEAAGIQVKEVKP